MEENWVIFQVIYNWRTTTLSSWLNAHSPWLLGQLEAEVSFYLHSMRVTLMRKTPQTAYRYGWSHCIVDHRFVEAFEARTLALKQSLSWIFHARRDHDWTVEWRCHRYALLHLYLNWLHGKSEPIDQASFRLLCMEDCVVQVSSAKLVTYRQVFKLNPTARKCAAFIPPSVCSVWVT